MSLKQTFSEIETIADGIPLLESFYYKRWEDTVDSVPTFVRAKLIKSLRNSYEIDFTIMDKVSDKDVEFDDVRSDTLAVFKMFFSGLVDSNIVDYDSITYEPLEDNQLVLL